MSCGKQGKTKLQSIFTTLIYAAAVVACIALIRQAVLVLIFGALLGLARPFPNPSYIRTLVPKILGTGVVGLGLTSSFAQLGPAVSHVTDIALLMVINIFFALVLCRNLGVSQTFAFMIASGTTICGGSAIMATAAVLNPPEEETATALSTIFILNAVSLFLLPQLAAWMRFDDMTFGLWAGLAIHDTASVMAALIALPADAMSYGASVKLLRTLFIVPTVFTITIINSHLKRKEIVSNPEKRWLVKLRATLFSSLPWFIPGYLVALAISQAGLVPEELKPTITYATKSLMITALFLVGTGLSFAKLKALGARPIALGIGIWACSALAAFTML